MLTPTQGFFSGNGVHVRSVTAQTMQDERAYTATHRVPSAPIIRLFDSKRLVEHCVADVVHQLMAVPNTDPEGLLVTVTLERMPDGTSSYVVTGSLSQDQPVSAD